MTKRWRRLLTSVTLVIGVSVAVLAGARALAPGWLRGFIQRSASQALGRELKIAGAVELSLSLTPSLAASDITLANASWGSESSMIRAGRIELSLDLVSLWSGPVTVRRVAIDDVRVLLERDRDGRPNWAFEIKPKSGPPADAAARRVVVIEQAAVRGFELVVRARPGARPLMVGVATLEAGLDPATHMIDVQASGHVNDSAWDVGGRVGPLESLYAGRDVDQALTGHIGQSALSLSGRIHDPMTLGGPNVDVKVDGPDIVAALAVFGLESPLTGAFRLDGRLAPMRDAVGVDLRGALGGVTATARGTVSALLRPERIAAEVAAAGPDAAVVGSWTGVAGLPARPFDLAGRLRLDGRRLSFDDLKLRAGGTSLEISGTLGELPRCVGTRLNVAATGSDLSELSALTRLRLPPDPFEVSGRFLRRADGLAIEATEVHVRGGTIHAGGTIGEPPRLDNLDLTVDGTGPDASFLSGIARIDLPADPFELRGRAARNGAAIELDGIAGRLGESAFEVSGSLVPVRGILGTDGRVRVAGVDLAKVGSLIGLRGLPAERFDVAGHVRVDAEGYALDGVEASVGRLSGTVDGRLGAPTPLDGTSLACRLRGSALSDLGAWGVPEMLPPDPFTASGRLRIDGGVYRVDGATAEVGADRIAIDGTLGALPDLAALDVAVEAAGPDLAALGRFLTAAGAEPTKRFPAERYSVTGRARSAPSGVAIEGMRAEIGDLTLSAEGTLGSGDRGLGTDVRFTAEAPGTSVLSQALGATIPDGALRAHGRIERTEHGLRLDDTAVSIGASYAEASGMLGPPPKLAGTDMDVSAEGPDLAALLDPWVGRTPVPADSFAVSAHVRGSAEQLTADRLDARLGDSDLTGSLSMRLEGRPFLAVDLRSKRLDIPRLLAGFTREPEPEVEAPTPTRAKKSRDKRDRLIPDQPLPLGGLAGFDGRLRLAAAEVLLPGLPVRDVEFNGNLRDGALSIDRTEGTGRNGGRMTSSASLRPEGDGYRLHAEGRLDGGRLDVTKTGDAPELAPSLDLEYELEGAGRSLHEIAANAEGRFLVVLGSGRIPNAILGGESSATLISLMDALNPFRKSSPYTAMECGVAVAGIDDGKMVVRPIAARTDKLTMIGKGKVDFGTEAIDLSWTIKPRRNIGISAGSIANPYIKLGGTLAAPRIDVKPVEAAASTGAAVVTAGLTILFRGIYNRITAERKVCVDALSKAEKQKDEREARKGAESNE